MTAPPFTPPHADPRRQLNGGTGQTVNERAPDIIYIVRIDSQPLETAVEELRRLDPSAFIRLFGDPPRLTNEFIVSKHEFRSTAKTRESVTILEPAPILADAVLAARALHPNTDLMDVHEETPAVGVVASPTVGVAGEPVDGSPAPLNTRRKGEKS